MAKHHKKKAKGGRASMWVSGNPDVEEEAREDKDGEETGHEKKRGGKVKKNKGGKVIGLMTGGAVRQRLDRPGRKTGGAVGANRTPLSTANSGSFGADGSSNPKDTYGGTPK